MNLFFIGARNTSHLDLSRETHVDYIKLRVVIAHQRVLLSAINDMSNIYIVWCSNICLLCCIFSVDDIFCCIILLFIVDKKILFSSTFPWLAPRILCNSTAESSVKQQHIHVGISYNMRIRTRNHTAVHWISQNSRRLLFIAVHVSNPGVP